MNLYIKTLLVIGFFIKYSFAVTNFGSCTTPNYEIAQCIFLTECTYLYQLMGKSPLSVEERNYLRSSQCGYQNNQVLLCCPDRYIQEQQQQPTRPTRPNRPTRPVSQPMTRPVPGPDSNNPRQTNYVHPNSLPKAPNCGEVFSDRIYGGNVTGRSEYPWLAMLEYTKPGNEKGHHCGGSLINERYVLTAAHCVSAIPSDWRLTGVRLGEWDTATNPDCVQQRNGLRDCSDEYIDIPVTQAVTHPEYNPRSRDQNNDIALLRLQNRVTFSQTVSPVCLPYHDEQRDNLYVGESMDVSGWGRTETRSASERKLKATVTVRNLQECARKYTSQRITLQANQLCAGGVEGVDSCRGDSGGPLVVLEKYDFQENFYLSGVVSFGPTPCGLRDWPGVYTRVGAYLNWIASNVRA